MHLQVDTKIDAYVFVSIINNFYNEDTRSKIMIKVGERLFIDVNYENLYTYDDASCRTYSHKSNESYDRCKWKSVGDMVYKKFKCSLPYVDTGHPFCKGNKTRPAYNLHWTNLNLLVKDCPKPCANMLANFGFPFRDPYKENVGAVKFYFKVLVKVTEEYISYGFLR